MKKFDMNWFLIFNAIYEEKSLVKAADRLGMSEKNLGLILKKQRIHFDNALFIRDKSGFIPTSLAIELYGKFDEILNFINQTIEFEQDKNKTLLNDIKITLSMNSNLQLLFNQIYAKTASSLSKFSFNLISSQNIDEEQKKLRQGLTDISISFEPMNDSFIASEMIFSSTISLCLVLSKKHPRYKKIACENNFENEKFVSCTSNTVLENVFFSQIKTPCKILYRSDSIFDVLGVIEHNDIIIICPNYFKLFIINDELFHVVELNAPDLVVKSLYINHAKSNRKNESILKISSILKIEIDKMKSRTLEKDNN